MTASSVIEAIHDPVEPWPPKAQAGPSWTPAFLRTPAPQASDETADALREARDEIERLKTALAEAERLADHDALTGLLNRRGFERELARTLAACRRYGQEAALIYFDLDGFKAVNDRYGHGAGDAALKAVGGVLTAGIRESDVAARLGGDEFAVILSHAGRAAANGKARILTAAVEALPDGAWGGGISLSYGVRAFETGMDADQMLAEADAAMFVRKGARRRA